MVKKTVFIAISATVLALSLIGIIILVTLYVIAINVGFQRSVVIDAGSSSSKVNIYQWKDDPFRTNGNVEQVNTITVKPGISASIANPIKAYPPIEPSLMKIVENISTKERHEMPIYLGATAGMRLAMYEDLMGSLDVFEALRRSIQTSRFQVETPNERIRLISGTEEGLFGWVSVNAILKLITDEMQVPPMQTVGSLDLGGASTQIAFSTKNTDLPDVAILDFTLLKLYGSAYNVYSHSFLCYGKDQMESRVKASIINQGNSTAANINNPCWHAGNTFADNADHIYNSPCITGPYADKVFTEKLKRPAGLSGFNFIGTGDPIGCDARVRAQFSTTTCNDPPCSFNNVHQPEVSGLFRAYSGFSFVMKHLFPNKVTGFTRNEVLTAVHDFCRINWNDLQKKVKPADHPLIAKFCFDGIYVIALLDNYGFKTDNQWKSITFGQMIDGKSVSWAFGYMLDQSGHLPSHSPKIRLPLAAFVPTLIILILIFAANLILLVLLVTGKLLGGA